MKLILEKRKILLTIFLFASLFINEDILVLGTINNSTLINVRLIIQILLTLVMMMYVILHKIPIYRKKVKIFVIFALFFMISMIVNADFRIGYIFLIMLYFDCILLTTIFSFDEIYLFFSKVMFVICVVSLFGFMLQIILPSILELFPVIENISRHKFYFLGLTNVSFKYDSFIRNWGPFREPGVFQAFIIIALIYNLFKEKNYSIIKPIVFIITLITTFSTTGYIALFLVLFAAVNIRKDKISVIQRRIIYIILIFSIIGLFYLTFFTDLMFKQDSYGSVFGKLFGGYESNSYNARIASIIVNFKIFLKNPICGMGITYVDEMFKPLARSLYGVAIAHNTNMLFIQLSKYGILTFIYTIYRYLKSISKSYDYGIFVWGAIFLAYIVLMFGENFSYSILITVPMFFIDRDFKDDLEKVVV